MSLQLLFPHVRGFRLLAFRRVPERVILAGERITRAACCPVCGGMVRRIHGPIVDTLPDAIRQILGSAWRLARTCYQL